MSVPVSHEIKSIIIASCSGCTLESFACPSDTESHRLSSTVGTDSAMALPVLPFRDINLHSSPSYYAFNSPSSPNSPALVVERPTGDLRLKDGGLLGAKRISSIAGILGIVKLKLGRFSPRDW